MTAYLLRRLLSLSLSLIAASLVIFLVMEVVPGDPASFMMGINADPQAVAALRTQLGLERAAASAISWLGRRSAAGRFRQFPIPTGCRFRN
jgi:ABC-type dipeptide/oligopeptide/nickel transport system permease component